MARASVASFRGPIAEQLVREHVGQLRDAQAGEKRLLKMLISAYQALPEPNGIDSIPGIGDATAAVLTAKMVCIERFATPRNLVGFFGIFPEASQSGFYRDGRRHLPGTLRMSAKGNDLVRKYLWNAAMSAINCNPAARALNRRLRRRGVRGDVALGHVARKLLHLVYAVWRSGKPFDREPYPWQDTTRSESLVPALPAIEKATRRTQEVPAKRSAVTVAKPKVNESKRRAKASTTAEPVVPPSSTQPACGSVDISRVRQRVNIEQVLIHLGLLSQLHGPSRQRRGPCPLHDRVDARERTFSVHLDKNVFQCFAAGCTPGCHASGNTLDLWAALHRCSVAQAAQQIASAFALDLTQPHDSGPSPSGGTRASDRPTSNITVAPSSTNTPTRP